MAFIGLTRGKMKVGAVFEIHLKSGTPDSQAREEIRGRVKRMKVQALRQVMPST